jgi:hypothetical protein
MTTFINASTSGGLIQTADTSGVLALQTANTTALTIDASQNVGIGIASPANKLAVVGGNAGNMLVDNGGQQYTQLLLQRNSTANTGGDILIDGTNSIMYLRSLFAGRISIGTSTSAGSPVERLSINTTGTLSLQGAATNTTGVGITFPATQSASSDANTLDDYEEGTWTPTATSQGGSITSYSANGSYVKIGKTVFVRAEIIITNVGTASGRIDGGGLPFIERGERPFVALARENAATGNTFVSYGQNGSTGFQITALTSVGPVTWTNNYSYVFTATYLTD